MDLYKHQGAEQLAAPTYLQNIQVCYWIKKEETVRDLFSHLISQRPPVHLLKDFLGNELERPPVAGGVGKSSLLLLWVVLLIAANVQWTSLNLEHAEFQQLWLSVLFRIFTARKKKAVTDPFSHLISQRLCLHLFKKRPCRWGVGKSSLFFFEWFCSWTMSKRQIYSTLNKSEAGCLYCSKSILNNVIVIELSGEFVSIDPYPVKNQPPVGDNCCKRRLVTMVII